MRCACVDIGSNTTRLLVAELRDGHLHEVACERVFTRIGAACDGVGMIAAEKVSEVAAVVAQQLDLAAELDAASTRIVATAAVRTAPNRDALTEAVREATGATVDVLDAEAEAHLAFEGLVRTLRRPPAGPLGVADIGGGSSELVVGTADGGVSWSASLEIGSGRLERDHLHSDPPGAQEIAEMRARVQLAFATVAAPPPVRAYAVGGSATSLQRLVGPELSPEALEGALALLAGRPAEELAEELGLAVERVHILPAGLVILLEASRAFGLPLHIGSGGLREGVVLQELDRIAFEAVRD